MSDADHPYRGPKRPGSSPPRGRGDSPLARPAAPPRPRLPTAQATPEPGDHRPPRRNDELRIYGYNACRAAFASRPADLRKVYLSEARIGALREVLAWCVKHRLGYRVVDDTDLDKLAASTHHEGVIFEMRRGEAPTLDELLPRLPEGPQLLLWLDGVGNPHNLGAVLRSAAHFGAAAVLVPADSGLTLSGAAYRVAEGGAEAVPVLRPTDTADALARLRASGFTLAATLPRDASSIYATRLPARLVLAFGAEGGGMQPELVEACSLRLGIPGSGRVESLNIANAAAAMLGEFWRQHR